MDQVSIKCTNIFHCKTLQNLPKLGFLVSTLATIMYTGMYFQLKYLSKD
jgi:hypothetical protein